ncbi:MAG TPA: LacI family DNA-binding transcriptional regulator, partial [Sporolactobacillaceae bacterium]|nr:LacI family DNA-binding transcriptional regulator [Sporolactobacillaceae bacterium]
MLSAARQLGYSPNILARGLTTKKSNIIGIVMQNLENPFYTEVLAKFYKKLNRKGYQFLFINAEDDALDEDAVSKLQGYNVDAVIITDALISSKAAHWFKKSGIPVVLFNRYVEPIESHVVCCNNFEGGKGIGTYLIKKGFRRFAFISGPVSTSTTREREKGFREALAGSGISEFEIARGDYTYEHGYNSAISLLEKKVPHPLQALFCANDILAIGAIEGVRHLGLRVPEDVAVIGFDDLTLSQWPSYALTTWKQPVNEMVDQTIALILSELEGGDPIPPAIH